MLQAAGQDQQLLPTLGCRRCGSLSPSREFGKESQQPQRDAHSTTVIARSAALHLCTNNRAGPRLPAGMRRCSAADAFQQRGGRLLTINSSTYAAMHVLLALGGKHAIPLHCFREMTHFGMKGILQTSTSNIDSLGTFNHLGHQQPCPAQACNTVICFNTR